MSKKMPTLLALFPGAAQSHGFLSRVPHVGPLLPSTIHGPPRPTVVRRFVPFCSSFFGYATLEIATRGDATRRASRTTRFFSPSLSFLSGLLSSHPRRWKPRPTRFTKNDSRSLNARVNVNNDNGLARVRAGTGCRETERKEEKKKEEKKRNGYPREWVRGG